MPYRRTCIGDTAPIIPTDTCLAPRRTRVGATDDDGRVGNPRPAAHDVRGSDARSSRGHPVTGGRGVDAPRSLVSPRYGGVLKSFPTTAESNGDRHDPAHDTSGPSRSQ